MFISNKFVSRGIEWLEMAEALAKNKHARQGRRGVATARLMSILTSRSSCHSLS